MITPQDIQDKEFAKGVRGYKEEDVDVFLDELTIQLDAMIKENEALKSKVAEQEAKIAEYRSQEGAVVKTLEAAKSLMNDISASAEKRADIIIRNAEIDAAAMVRQSKANLVNLQAEEKVMIERVKNFKKNFKSLLETELSRFSEVEGACKAFENEKLEEAKSQFDSIVNSVDKTPQEKDFFDISAFNNLENDLTKTIVSMDRHSKGGE